MSTIYLWNPEPPGGGIFDQDEDYPIDLRKASNIEFEDIDYADYPDFCDAFISYAEIDGKPLTEEQLEELNNDSEFVHEKLMDYLY